MGKTLRGFAWLPVLVVACGGAADLGGSGGDAGACATVCCVPSPIGVGTPSFQCVGAGVACSLPDSACEAADAGASCDKVCCDAPPGGQGNPRFQCVAAGVACALPNADCLAADAGVAPATDAGGGAPCTATADCNTGATGQNPYVCGYPLGAGCNATGTCMPAGPLCNSISPTACACSGTSTAYGGCSGYPTGYAGTPTLHTGACAADGSAAPACETAADCDAGEVCVQDYDPQVGPDPVGSRCIANPCGSASLACSCAVAAACAGFSVNCAIGAGSVVECLGNG